MTKLVSNCAFHLKGSGWYVSDYSSSSRPNSANPDTSKEAGAAKAEKSEAAAGTASAAPPKIK